MRIAGRDVVIGDLVILAEGDRIPADALVLEETNFNVNEAMLTGESLPVSKHAWLDKDMPAADLENRHEYFVFGGTLAVKGQAMARVLQIGAQTEMGKIGVSLKILQPEQTFIQRETKQLVKIFAVVAVSACLIVFSYYLLAKADLLHGILSGLTLAISILPEELPVVLTVFLSLGAWRISQRKVLARRVSAIEMLGAATVLCTDKTGTLTQNKISVEELSIGAQRFAINQDSQTMPASFQELVQYTVLASPPDPFDPMEKAMRALAKRVLPAGADQPVGWSFAKEYPLVEKLLAVAAKGAPEAIIDLCHLSALESEQVLKQVQLLAAAGRRVMAVARANWDAKQLPTSQHDYDFKLLGLLGLADPIRPEAKAAIAQCYGAGIRVVMITGDYPATAAHIATELGLDFATGILTGEEVESLAPAQLKKKVAVINIFARMAPAQKLKLVKALKANGEVVAMTGDGVNDAPALKAAHIGVAMGQRGTDVAREAAGLVLLDDNFASIVAAVRMGRRIFINLKKAMSYLLAVHLPIIGLSLIPLLAGMPIALLPAHIVFLELIIDPACSIAFEMEPEEKGIMKRRPRLASERILDRRTIIKAMIRGLAAAAICVSAYIWAATHWPLEEARLVGFICVVAVNLAFILSGRSETQNIFKTIMVPNRAVWLLLVGTLILQVVIFSFAPAARLFGFGEMHSWHYGWGIAAFVLALAIGEGTKLMYRKPNA